MQAAACQIEPARPPARACRLAAHALHVHAAKHWGQALLFVRDQAVERVGHEESAVAAQELRGVMLRLAEACIEAYCRGHLSALGAGSKEELPREWLSRLLITPLLRAASRWGCSGV